MVESSGTLQSFIPYDASKTHFPLENIPFGVCQVGIEKHVCTRIGDNIIDLSVLFAHGFLPKSGSSDENVFMSNSLNAFIAQGKDYWHQVRVQI